MAENTAERVFRLIEPTVRAQGLTLWDVRYVKEGAAWYLRVFIDRDGGVGIDDCERVSRAIDPILDEQDPIESSYYLEVSSPGLSRELTRQAHFDAMRGRPVLLRLYRPRDGKREIAGTLLSADAQTVTLQTETGTEAFERSAVATVRLDDADF